MGVFLNRGIDAFEKAINSEIFVDKSGLVAYCNRVINTEQCYMCVSRPRRFGKSMAAGMLEAFYEKGVDTESIFEGLEVSQSVNWKENLNRFDVIKLDMADIVSDTGSGESALDYIDQMLTKDLREAYPEIDLSLDKTVPSILFHISQETSQRFIIIIDEWDFFFRDDNSSESIKNRYITFLRALFKGDRSKSFVALAYITGILPIKQYSSESALNNFWEYTMTSPKKLAEYVGFTATEVEMLCDRYGMDYVKAKEWYDGYRFGYQEHIYGPNSVVNAMLNGEFANYWSKTVAFKSLSVYITMNFDGLKDSIVKLMCGGREKVDITGYENDLSSIHNRDDVLTVLIHLGYLAYDIENEEVYIPNKEVWEIFDKNLKNTDWDEVIAAVNTSEQLLKHTLAGEADAVARLIDECHRQNFSILKYNDENSLAACITLAYYTAKKDYMIVREMPAGYGFADIVFIPKTPGKYPAMVIELKWNKDASAAIKQIKKKKYIEALDGYTGEVLLVGIDYSMDDKDEGHNCVIEREWITE